MFDPPRKYSVCQICWLVPPAGDGSWCATCRDEWLAVFRRRVNWIQE